MGNIKHCGTNFVILNIFWKQKIVKTVWPVRVKSSASGSYVTQYETLLLLELHVVVTIVA